MTPIRKRACSIRLHADMSEGFWTEAVNHASYQVNMSHQHLLIFRSQKRYDEESLWTIQPYVFLAAGYIVWLIVRKGTNWSPSLRSVSSSGLPKKSRVSDFKIPRKGSLLPAEKWFLMKNQYCKKSQRQRIKSKVELQTVWQQTLRKRKLCF